MRTMNGHLVDLDTYQYGTDGSFQGYESDSTALWHVLLTAKRANLVLDENAEEIADLILRSRWMAATRTRRVLVDGLITGLPGQPIDTDSLTKGTRGPFQPGEGDRDALMRVLASAHDHGFTIAANCNEIMSLIYRSRWRCAVIAEAAAGRTETAEVGA